MDRDQDRKRRPKRRIFAHGRRRSPRNRQQDRVADEEIEDHGGRNRQQHRSQHHESLAVSGTAVLFRAALRRNSVRIKMSRSRDGLSCLM